MPRLPALCPFCHAELPSGRASIGEGPIRCPGCGRPVEARNGSPDEPSPVPETGRARAAPATVAARSFLASTNPVTIKWVFFGLGFLSGVLLTAIVFALVRGF
jgi:hypothetical protein